MIIVYASRTGNVKALVDKLNGKSIVIDEAGNITEDYILFTYTDGAGEVPYEVDDFLLTNSTHLKGVVASGDMMYGEENFAKAGDIIAETYGVPCLYKVENDGTDEDVANISKLLAK